MSISKFQNQPLLLLHETHTFVKSSGPGRFRGNDGNFVFPPIKIPVHGINHYLENFFSYK